MFTIFIVGALVLLAAFAYLFYITTMTSLEDNRTLFVRVYVLLLVVLAIGAFKLSARAGDCSSETNKMVKAELNKKTDLAVAQQTIVKQSVEENGNV